VEGYNWSKADTSKMVDEMSAVRWGEILAGETVENAWQVFKGKLSETVERNVPKHGTRTPLKNPWMTREILRMVRKKRRKWKTVKMSANAEELREYRAIEKETAKKIRNAKRKFDKNLVSGEDKNNRKFARYIVKNKK
jgi:ribosomal protein L15